MAIVTEPQATPAPIAPPTPATREGIAVKLGLLAGVGMIVVAATGMVQVFQQRVLVHPFLRMGTLALYLVTFAFAYTASRPPEQLEGYAPPKLGRGNVTVGVVTGFLAGAVFSAFILFIGAVNLREIFINLSPEMLEMVRFGQSEAVAVLLIVAISAAVGAAAGALHVLPPRFRKPLLMALAWVLVVSLLEIVFSTILRNLGLTPLGRFLYLSTGGLTLIGAILVAAAGAAYQVFAKPRLPLLRTKFDGLPQRRRRRWIVLGLILGVVVIYLIPRVTGPFISQVLDLAGITLLMALGLNIVVGYAGLLDLGYVAFYAVGAYTTAVLTSPNVGRGAGTTVFEAVEGAQGLRPIEPLGFNWWQALPLVFIAAAMAGVIVATPVLRLRGDYLAIVTLGFGEIARILLNSQWLAPVFGGAQGVVNIPGIRIGPLSIRTPEHFFYIIFACVLVAAYVSLSLHRSRSGRAWMAMREDEDAAEAMGIRTVVAKLKAFVMGALFASVGGALFAAQIGSVFPNSFNVVVSITVLVVIIVGGIGNVPGVMVGALVLVALPELLREFSEFKFLLYGALLIFMMLKRPEGFIPSKIRAQELHREETRQDAWLEIYGQAEETKPAPAAGS